MSFSDRFSTACLAAGSVLTLGGCFYGPPPGQYPPMPAQPQVAPTPAEPSTTFAPDAATNLDEIPDARVNDVLTVPQPRDPGTVYEVRQGDSLTSIAQQFGVTVQDLMTANSFDGEPVLQPGFQLRIPSAD